jgi:hypothetical protein
LGVSATDLTGKDGDFTSSKWDTVPVEAAESWSPSHWLSLVDDYI